MSAPTAARLGASGDGVGAGFCGSGIGSPRIVCRVVALKPANNIPPVTLVGVSLGVTTGGLGGGTGGGVLLKDCVDPKALTGRGLAGGSA